MSDLRTPSAGNPVAAPSDDGGYVLVVDDHRDAADSLARLLSVLGKKAQVAYDAAAALELIEQRTPNLILLDLGMPKIDGFEVARRITSRPKWRDIPLVALTGLGQEQDRERTAAAGFVDHLLKPVDLSLLERTLERLLPP